MAAEARQELTLVSIIPQVDADVHSSRHTQDRQRAMRHEEARGGTQVVAVSGANRRGQKSRSSNRRVC